MDIKRFAIIAAAFTGLSLHTELAQAISCPAIIAGTTLADTVCDFDSSSSVTVQNGGEVGGITMNSYSPSSSYILVAAGGLITNSVSEIGIKLDDSSLSNGITNNGTISTDSYALDIINSSSVSGGITNGGIMTDSTSAAILIEGASTINGNITNSGTLSGGANDSGVNILDSSTAINGDFTNTGIINGGSGGGSAVLFRESTLNGDFTNSGTINGYSSGLVFLNAATITGNISNSGSILGTANGLDIRNASQVNGSISNTGLINGSDTGLAIESDSHVSGGISNTGTIRGGTYGLEVNDNGSVSGRISNSGIIQGGTDAIFINSDSTASNIDIAGQSARVIGAVDATNTNFNLTSGATFTSEGSFNINNFNIASNAIFNMNNNITAQTGVNNSGALNVATANRSISGNYTQNTGGIFQLGISGGSYGQLSASGAVDLSQSGNINVQVASNSTISSGEVFSNIISGSAFTTAIGGFSVSDNSFLWDFNASLNMANTGVNLTATLNSGAYNTCQGDYCQAAANVIINQVAAGNSAFSNYSTLTTASAFQTAASQATPELTNENIQAVQFETRSVMDVVPMWSDLHGESAGDAMIYEPGKWWMKPYGGSMSQDRNNTVPGFNADVYGAILGRDTQLSDNSLFGGAIAFGKSNLNGYAELNTEAINSDIYQGILYGTRQLPHNLYIAGQGLLGYENNDTTRAIPLYASTASGSYDSWFTNLRSQLGWNAYATQNLVITPNIDASYVFVNQNSYQESGSIMDLAVDSNSNSSLVLGAYTNAAYHLATSSNKQKITLTGYAGIASDVLNSTPQVNSTFVAGGPSFSTFGAQFNSVVFRGGLGLNFQHPTQPYSLSLNYDLQAGNNAYSGVGSATLSYKL